MMIKNKINIAMVTHRCPPETFICDLIINLKSFNPIIFAKISTKGKNTLPDRISIYSLSELEGFSKFLNNFTSKYGRCKYFEDAIKKNNIKLLHAHFGFLGVNMQLLARKLEIPLITHFRGQDTFQLTSNPYYSMLLKKLFKTEKFFIVVSNHMKNYLINKLGCPKEKIHVLYGGIDLNKFPFIPKKSKNQGEQIAILMCGRLVEKKGFPYGIKAFAECFKKHKNIKMQIIGHGPLDKKLKKLIENLELGKIISLLGEKNHVEVAEAMRKADIFMMPYATAKNGDSEGLPNVLKEAMATGLPVISTKHTGVPEIVKDGQTGFLVNEKDTAAISNRLNYLIENPDRWVDFGINGRKIIENAFDIVRQTQKLEEIYKAAINQYKE